jgi:ribonuclease J
MLADEGVVMVVANVDLHSTQVVGIPRVITRGWVHAPEAEDLLEEAATVVGDALANAMTDGARDVEVLSRTVRRALGAFVSERTRRRPLIIPVVLAV